VFIVTIPKTNVQLPPWYGKWFSQWGAPVAGATTIQTVQQPTMEHSLSYVCLLRNTPSYLDSNSLKLKLILPTNEIAYLVL